MKILWDSSHDERAFLRPLYSLFIKLSFSRISYLMTFFVIPDDLCTAISFSYFIQQLFGHPWRLSYLSTMGDCVFRRDDSSKISTTDPNISRDRIKVNFHRHENLLPRILSLFAGTAIWLASSIHFAILYDWYWFWAGLALAPMRIMGKSVSRCCSAGRGARLSILTERCTGGTREGEKEGISSSSSGAGAQHLRPALYQLLEKKYIKILFDNPGCFLSMIPSGSLSFLIAKSQVSFPGVKVIPPWSAIVVSSVTWRGVIDCESCYLIFQLRHANPHSAPRTIPSPHLLSFWLSLPPAFLRAPAPTSFSYYSPLLRSTTIHSI